MVLSQDTNPFASLDAAIQAISQTSDPLFVDAAKRLRNSVGAIECSKYKREFGKKDDFEGWRLALQDDIDALKTYGSTLFRLPVYFGELKVRYELRQYVARTTSGRVASHVLG